jgi:beta-lactamase regulating signal transducer with metallopeptidase domain
LLHELAHVKRGDLLAQNLAQLACALYWFNPLAWVAAHRLRIEREQACDDTVLSAGTKASDYANHILEIIRSLRIAKCPALAAVAMAQCSQIEHRLRAILNPRLCRRALTSKGEMLVGAAVACMVLPLAAMKPSASAETESNRATEKRMLPKFEMQTADSRISIAIGAVVEPATITPYPAKLTRFLHLGLRWKNLRSRRRIILPI